MATKAQKRAAGLAKREAFLKEERERGLAAQKADQDSRRKKSQEANRKRAEIDTQLKQSMSRSKAFSSILDKEFVPIETLVSAIIMTTAA
jgi:hypothetical protein